MRMRIVDMQKRAHECRQLAAIVRDPKARDTYLMAAGTWETLVRQAEAVDIFDAQSAAIASAAERDNSMDPGKTP